jgi:hypothetical protein
MPAYSEMVYMSCVDGWGFTAKWTGIRVTDLLNLSGIRPEASKIHHIQELRMLLNQPAFGISARGEDPPGIRYQ